MEERAEALKLAERGAVVSIIAYICLSLFKLIMGYIGHSEALTADGWNNFTDILSSIFVFIGLRLARQPSDDEHRYGHWKIENIASLITSLIMVFIGIDVLINPIKRMLLHQIERPDFTSSIVGFITGIIMLFVYLYNKRLAQKVKSSALMAAAKDNLSDAYTSFGTALAIVFSTLGLTWLDNLTAIIIGFIIIKTAIDIFSQSVFALSDGFNNLYLSEYEAYILSIDKVDGIRQIRGRNYGENIYLDIVVYMSPDMTVAESHAITEEIEHGLSKYFNVYHSEVHVEPTEE